MKNVTIALDDDTHRKARIRAAELGTSLSALVKAYLATLATGDAPVAGGQREVGMEFKHAEPAKHGPPWFIDGKWVYTPDGKPRQPGALRGKYKKSVSEEDLQTPQWLIDIMENGDDDFSDILEFDESQLPTE
jgi:plasmid stability protein